MLDHPGKYARVELERRFLLDRVPEAVEGRTGRLIVDRYIVGTTLRLRRVEALDTGESSYKLGQKTAPDPGDFSRAITTNIYLSDAEYAALAPLPANELRKRRFALDHAGDVYAIDVFEGALTSLVLAEITFETELELAAHPPPPFAVRDVSSELAYTGGALAQAISPPGERPSSVS
ncbi:MAG TPA: hypothetical protein VH572_02730 [Gaiella sp.]